MKAQKDADSMFIRYIAKDTRYNKMNLHECMMARANIYNDKHSTKYDRALIQYHIMRLDGRMAGLPIAED